MSTKSFFGNLVPLVFGTGIALILLLPDDCAAAPPREIPIELQVEVRATKHTIIGAMVFVDVTIRNTTNQDIKLLLPVTTLYGIMHDQPLRIHVRESSTNKELRIRSSIVDGPRLYVNSVVLSAKDSKTFTYEFFSLLSAPVLPGEYQIYASYDRNKMIVQSDSTTINMELGTDNDVAAYQKYLKTAHMAGTDSIDSLKQLLAEYPACSVRERATIDLVGALSIAGQNKDAIKWGLELLKKRPEDQEKLRWLVSRCLEEVGDYMQAIEVLEPVKSLAAREKIEQWRIRAKSVAKQSRPESIE